MIQQDIINNEFKDIINRESIEDRDASLMAFKYSGYKILDKIGKNERILDIGCGRNLFKLRRPNLLGIDPVHDSADIKIAFQDFETTEIFDTILCLGSIQFGELEDIKFLIKKLTGMIKPGGKVFWRCDTNNNNRSWKFAWKKEFHYEFANEFDYSVIELQDDYIVAAWKEGNPLKIYAEWIKN